MRQLIVALLLALSGAVLAGTTGKISGQVLDRDTREPLVGANVFVEGTVLGASTDGDGYFFILNVPPGTYTVTSQYLGFDSMSQTNVLVQVDRTTELTFPIRQSVGGSADVVVVEAERPPVERDVTSTVQNVTSERIDALPVNSLTDILELQSGVVNTGALHVRGGRSGEVAYFIDGHRVEDPLFGGQVIDINNEAIEQLEFLSGTFNAEYGNALSGVVNVVTKENFETLRGNVTYKRTNLGLEDASDNLNENYVECYVNGPLGVGLPIGFMVSARRIDADNYYLSGLSEVVQTDDGRQFRSLDGSEGDPFGYEQSTSLYGKLYMRPFSSGKLSLAYNFSDTERQSYVHDLKYIPDSSYVRNTASHLVAATFTHGVSNSLFYDLRLSFYQYDYLRRVDNLHYSEYSAPLFLRFANSRFFRSQVDVNYEDQLTRTWTAKGDVSYQWNRYHLFKAGVELKRHDFDYFFIADPAVDANTYVNEYSIAPWEGAIYLQDKVEFETVILNLGLRYDWFDPNAEYPLDPAVPDGPVTTSEIKTQISPRVGIAYPVRENMVFHFAYGQFFQRPSYDVMYENLDRSRGNDEPLFGSPNLEAEKTASYELGLNTTIGAGIKLQTTFFSKKIEDLVGVAWAFRPFPYAVYINEDFATVKGFEVSGEWRGRHLAANVNYTFQDAEGSASSQQERFGGAFNIVGTQSLQFYPLNFDQRHTANGSLSMRFGKGEAPFGWMPAVFGNTSASLVGRYGSGLPYTFNPLRAVYVPDRNNSRIDWTLTVDVELQKDFYVGPTRLSVFAEILNLLDRDNIRSVYSATGEPDDSGSLDRNITYEFMADPTNFYPPRTIYLGVRLGL